MEFIGNRKCMAGQPYHKSTTLLSSWSNAGDGVVFILTIVRSHPSLHQQWTTCWHLASKLARLTTNSCSFLPPFSLHYKLTIFTHQQHLMAARWWSNSDNCDRTRLDAISQHCVASIRPDIWAIIGLQVAPFLLLWIAVSVLAFSSGWTLFDIEKKMSMSCNKTVFFSNAHSLWSNNNSKSLCGVSALCDYWFI